MLASLEVCDFAYIEQARLELPAAGFCVLTGETGVGKSLLIDALALALGERLRRDVVRAGAARAEVSLLLELSADDFVHSWLAEQGLSDDSEQLIVRRCVDSNRRSRVYINGRLATLTQLAQLTAPLIGICGQHEHLLLRNAERRCELLDASAKTARELACVRGAYTRWSTANTKLVAIRSVAQQASERLASLHASLDEFTELGVSAERLAEQDLILSRQGNAAELGELHGALERDFGQVSVLVSTCRSVVARLAELDADCVPLAQQLAVIENLVNDTVREAVRLRGDGVELDAEALAVAEAFVATHRLARKHRLVGPQALLEFIADLKCQCASLQATDVDALEAQVAAALDDWKKQALALTSKRADAARTLASKVQAALYKLGMAGAKFRVKLTPQEGPSATGAERVELLFAARADTQPADLGEIASGGELSRVSLALFVHAAAGGRDLVFDEVDTGVGGKAAAYVGSLLAELGKSRLVLCVTHLPQVAAAADVHWQVASKQGSAQFTQVTGVTREEEIARMLAGRKVTKASRANARDILAAAN